LVKVFLLSLMTLLSSSVSQSVSQAFFLHTLYKIKDDILCVLQEMLYIHNI
jgi:hypothetical protein